MCFVVVSTTIQELARTSPTATVVPWICLRYRVLLSFRQVYSMFCVWAPDCGSISKQIYAFHHIVAADSVLNSITRAARSVPRAACWLRTTRVGYALSVVSIQTHASHATHARRAKPTKIAKAYASKIKCTPTQQTQENYARETIVSKCTLCKQFLRSNTQE